jgi:hypothetical protein
VVEAVRSGETELATILSQVAEALVVVELVMPVPVEPEPKGHPVKEVMVATAPHPIGYPVEVVVLQVLAARPLAQAEVQVVQVEP